MVRASKSVVEDILQNGISENPLMLRGVAVENIIYMFENGVMPPSTTEDESKNHLYFWPIRKNFKRFERIYREFERCGVKFAIEESKSYAKLSAADEYMMKVLIDELHMPPEHARKLYNHFDAGFRYDGPKKYEKQALKLDWNNIYKSAKKRKGVLLEPKRKILDDFIPKLPDGLDDGIRIYCPKGLDIKYVHGVKPLGKIEEVILNSYLKSLS